MNPTAQCRLCGKRTGKNTTLIEKTILEMVESLSPSAEASCRIPPGITLCDDCYHQVKMAFEVQQKIVRMQAGESLPKLYSDPVDVMPSPIPGGISTITKRYLSSLNLEGSPCTFAEPVPMNGPSPLQPLMNMPEVGLVRWPPTPPEPVFESRPSVLSPGRFAFNCRDCDAQYHTAGEYFQHKEEMHPTYFPRPLPLPLLTGTRLRRSPNSPAENVALVSSSTQSTASAAALVPAGKKKRARVFYMSCDECDDIFYSTSDFIKHRDEMHKRPMVCQLCQQRFYQQLDLEWHFRTMHPKLKYFCGVCKLSYDSSAQLKTHRPCNFTDPFICIYCPEIFETEIGLQMHKKIMHRLELYQELEAAILAKEAERSDNEEEGENQEE